MIYADYADNARGRVYYYFCNIRIKIKFCFFNTNANLIKFNVNTFSFVFQEKYMKSKETDDAGGSNKMIKIVMDPNLPMMLDMRDHECPFVPNFPRN